MTKLEKTTLIFILTFAVLCFIARSCGAEDLTPLSVAQDNIGLGEIGANNKGIYVRQYLNGQENLPWCAGFISYCLKQAGFDIPYYLQAKSFLKVGKRVNTPKAGDLIIFSRKGGGHIGIIEQVKDNKIITIEGNLGIFPAKVKRVFYKGKPKNLLAYVRLDIYYGRN